MLRRDEDLRLGGSNMAMERHQPSGLIWRRKIVFVTGEQRSLAGPAAGAD